MQSGEGKSVMEWVRDYEDEMREWKYALLNSITVQCGKKVGVMLIREGGARAGGIVVDLSSGTVNT